MKAVKNNSCWWKKNGCRKRTRRRRFCL